MTDKSESALREGWHNTEKYGEVYVSPGGIAWVVQRIGDRLQSIAVKLAPSDIVKTTAVDRMKRNLADRRRYKLRVPNGMRPDFKPQDVSKASNRVMVA